MESLFAYNVVLHTEKHWSQKFQLNSNGFSRLYRADEVDARMVNDVEQLREARAATIVKLSQEVSALRDNLAQAETERDTSRARAQGWYETNSRQATNIISLEKQLEFVRATNGNQSNGIVGLHTEIAGFKEKLDIVQAQRDAARQRADILHRGHVPSSDLVGQLADSRQIRARQSCELGLLRGVLQETLDNIKEALSK
jgi:uncharacterized coiled-coil DUF342 family protein